jgi:hypothetical protein
MNHRNRADDEIAAMRSERGRHHLIDLLEREQNRFGDLSRRIEMTAWRMYPANRTVQNLARRWLANAALIVITGKTSL